MVLDLTVSHNVSFSDTHPHKTRSLLPERLRLHCETVTGTAINSCICWLISLFRLADLLMEASPQTPGLFRGMRVYRPMRVKARHGAELHAPSHRPMRSPGYSSARLRPRRAGLRFTRCAHLTNLLIQHRSCSGSDTTFLVLPMLAFRRARAKRKRDSTQHKEMNDDVYIMMQFRGKGVNPYGYFVGRN